MTRFAFPALLAAALGGLAVAKAALPDAPSIAQARREAEAAGLRSAQLEREARRATDEAARMRARAEAMVFDIQRIEADLTVAEAHIASAGREAAERRARLAERQQPIVRLTAALQVMARRPPALALVQPGSTHDMARLRAVLASSLPVVRARTRGLRAELEAAEMLRAKAAHAAAEVAAARQALIRRRTELARLEKAQLARSEAFAGAALLEGDRSIALGEAAREGEFQTGDLAQRRRLEAELAALPGPALRPFDGGEAPRPALRYSLPIAGRLVTGVGELSPAGVHARGLTLAAEPGAPVAAPREGRVVYAGRFRSYGEIVIIDHGGGWVSTLTRLEALRVRRGDRVEAGDPIGRAGGEMTVELRRDGRPQPIAPLLG